MSSLSQGPPGLPGLKGDSGVKGEKVSQSSTCQTECVDVEHKLKIRLMDLLTNRLIRSVVCLQPSNHYPNDSRVHQMDMSYG